MTKYIIKTPLDKQGRVWYLHASTPSHCAWTTDEAKAMRFPTYTLALDCRDIQRSMDRICFVSTAS